MNPSRRQEYLRAMGIDIWLPRSELTAAERGSGTPMAESSGPSRWRGEAEAENVFAQRIVVGPGDGNTLLLCGGPDEVATELAADIARSLEGEPVWAWPASDASAPETTLADAIEEHLFTRVLILARNGPSDAAGRHSRIAGQAQLIWADPIPVLLKSGAARRGLWEILNAGQWCAERARTP